MTSVAEEDQDLEQPLLEPSVQHLLQCQVDDQDRFLPAQGPGFCSSLFFSWVGSLLSRGASVEQLHPRDLPPAPPSTAPDLCGDALWESWQRELAVAPAAHRSPSLLRAIFRPFGMPYVMLGFIKLANDGLNFAGPVLLNCLLRYLDASRRSEGLGGPAAITSLLTTTSPSRHLWMLPSSLSAALDPSSHVFGALCATLLAASIFVKGFLNAHFSYRQGLIAVRLRGALTSAVFRQTLTLPASSMAAAGTGQVQTLMSVDAEKVLGLCVGLHELWSLPMQIIIALVLLYTQVQFAFLAGLGLVLLIIPINRVLASGIQRASVAMMAAKDRRLSVVAELLRGVRAIKAAGWEPAFSARVNDARRQEIKALAVRKYLDAFCVYLWAATQLMFSLGTFGLFALLGKPLTAEVVFTSLALFGVLLGPINSFPWVINGIVEAVVSVRRLSSYLELKGSAGAPKLPKVLPDPPSTSAGIYTAAPIDDNLQMSADTTLTRAAAPAVEVSGTFAWGSGLPPVLHGINLSITPGALVAITGDVGAGKSSLLSAILGEMHPLPGAAVTVNGSTCYAAQEPWAMPGSVRDNILLGAEFDAEQYNAVVGACALGADLAALPSGDASSVGDGGATLSGGQRARVGLARALYRNADVYILDDILASVDAHVCAWLVQNALKGPLVHGKTLIVATHSPKLLEIADVVVSMAEGRINSVVFQSQAPRTQPSMLRRMGSDGSAAAAAVLWRSWEVASSAGSAVVPSMLSRSYGSSKDGTTPTAAEAAAAAAAAAPAASAAWAAGEETKGAAFSFSLPEKEEFGASSGGAPEAGKSLLPPSFFSSSPKPASSFLPPPPSTSSVLSNVQPTALLPLPPVAEAVLEQHEDGVGGFIAEGRDLQQEEAEEERVIGHVRWPVYRLYIAMQGFWAPLTLVALALMQATRNTSDLWLSYWVTHASSSDARGSNVFGSSATPNEESEPPPLMGSWMGAVTPEVRFYLGVLIIIAGANTVATLIRAFAFARGGLLAAERLHSRLLSSVLALPPSFFDSTPSGRILNRFSSDTATADDSLPFIANIFLAQAFGLAGVVAVLCFTQPYVLVALMPIAVVYRSMQRYYRSTSRELRRLEAVAKSPVYSAFSGALAGGTTIRALGAAGTFLHAAHGAVAGQQRASLAAIAASAWLGLRLQMMAGGIAAVISGLAVSQHAQHAAHAAAAGLVGLSLTYVLPITGLLNGLLTAGAETEQEMVSVERIRQYICDAEPQPDVIEPSPLTAGPGPWLLTGGLTVALLDGGDSENGGGASPLLAVAGHAMEGPSPRFSTAERHPVPHGWPFAGAVAFRNVWLRYGPSAPFVLQHFSLEVAPGKKAGIVGRTGAGKSSALACLLRLAEASAGEITIDGIDVRTVPLHRLRRSIGYVSQAPFLFQGTVAENLDPLRLSSVGEMEDALKCVGLWPALLALLHRDGEQEGQVTDEKEVEAVLQLQLGEGGAGLSRGQQQMLCLARVVLRKPKVVLLDEASASVDPATAAAMQNVISERLAGCTVIQVAHQLLAVGDCDVVFVVEGGRVLETGAPHELGAAPTSIFAGMLREQNLIGKGGVAGVGCVVS